VEALARISERSDCSVVLDVGANEGEFVEELRSHGYGGEVISFEPRREAFTRLENRASRDARWTTLRFALGADRRAVPINISENGVSSSMLPMRRLHLDAAPDSTYVGVEQVRQERLDDIVLPRLVDEAFVVMKLDVQGYEAAVLDGARKLLDRTVAIHLELSLAPVYEGQAEWRELAGGLLGLGFEFWALEPVLTDPATGRTLQVDVLMCRTQA
jgi:FkbM family methyltransferase